MRPKNDGRGLRAGRGEDIGEASKDYLDSDSGEQDEMSISPVHL